MLAKSLLREQMLRPEMVRRAADLETVPKDLTVLRDRGEHKARVVLKDQEALEDQTALKVRTTTTLGMVKINLLMFRKVRQQNQASQIQIH